MRKKFFVLSILGSLLFMNSCRNSAGDPKGVLLSFFDALGKKDIEGARKFATAESKSMLDMIDMGLKAAKDNKDMDKFDKSKMEFGEAKIDGDKAIVPVKEKSSGELTNFSLKKENGAWKVAFDKSSMMEMGMEKMKEHGGNTDSLKKGMDELKDMNIDSVKDAMEKSTKILDSVDKMIKDIKAK
jgi:hypothetical protein